MAEGTAPTPQTVADAVGRGMLADDAASTELGMRVVAMGPGYAKLSMRVLPRMLNGFKICHGGYITTLADSAFAFACNSYNELTVAAGIVVDFLAPGRLDDELTAEAHEVSLAGRTGVYDVTVRNQKGDLIAVLRGRSYRLKGRQTVPLAP
ncbi:MAG: hydroxyphenylacetyl-CoA thioesterase PaaI [Burkholderiales bacterium]